ALAAQTEGLAVLGALRDVDLGLAAQGRHLDAATQRRRGQRHGHRAVQVVAVALEDLVLLDADLDVEVAGRAAIGARLAVAGRADAHAFVDARRDLDFQRLGLLDAALAMAGRAGLGDDLAGAGAVRTGLLHAEETLAHVHRARAIAGRAGLGTGAGLGAGAVADVAFVPGGDADVGVPASGRLFHVDILVVGQTP